MAVSEHRNIMISEKLSVFMTMESFISYSLAWTLLNRDNTNGKEFYDLASDRKIIFW